MLLISVAENKIGLTWREMKRILSAVLVGIHRTAMGEVWQTNPLSSDSKSILETLNIKISPKFYAIKHLEQK